MSDLICPFCIEGDFDYVGLKHHLLAGHCEDFNSTPSIERSGFMLESELATVKAENARIKFDYSKMLAQLDGEIAVQKAALFTSEKILSGLIPRCKTIEEENEKLRAAIEKTINDNLHLADGENCTLIELKRAIVFIDPQPKCFETAEIQDCGNWTSKKEAESE